jgi:diguanylate cyclase (GGDEF)-like protein
LLEGTGFLVRWHDVTAENDLLKEREHQLLVDALTGIPNRRAMETALRVEQERMNRSGRPFCVAVFDVDHFKRVNDRFGHGAGDDVLRGVAGTLAGQGRLTDTVGRWGGEEFVAVLGGKLDGARRFCERARAAIEMMSCPPVERITISGGLVEVAEGENASDAVARADKRLYEAKTAGRNRVTV